MDSVWNCKLIFNSPKFYSHTQIPKPATDNWQPATINTKPKTSKTLPTQRPSIQAQLNRQLAT